MMPVKLARGGGLLGLALALAPAPAMACATCFGKSDDLMAQGMNMGIFTLLLVILSVLIGIASVGVFFARRAARFAATGSAEPASSATSEANT